MGMFHRVQGNAPLWRAAAALTVVAALAAGCGVVADQDRIQVASFDGEAFTRGDLMAVIREKPPEERPIIRTRRDLREALEDHIDTEIKVSLGLQLQAEGAIDVPRDAARQVYFAQNPEQAQALQMVNPEEWGLDAAGLMAMEDEMEFRIDRLHDRMLGEEAVRHRIRQALASGALTVTEDEVRAEFEARGDSIVQHETVAVDGVFFPGNQPNAMNVAAEARRQLDQGADIEDVAAQYVETGQARRIRTRLVNDPASPAMQRYHRFWAQATGAEEGEGVGPILIPSPEVGRQSPGGETQWEQLPDSYLVCKIVEHTEERPLTLEEAQDELAGPILYRKVMEQLRAEYGVEIYEDQLPDPALFDTDTDGPMA